VRPLRDELKCRDMDLYRAAYCGLCRTMRRRCGLLSTLLLNYDFTFLALLMAPPEGEKIQRCYRCHVPPFRRKCMCRPSPALERAADESVILAYWKWKDHIRDEGFWGKMAGRAVCAVYSHSYRRAAAARPEFELNTRQQLEQLYRLEEERCPSIDRTADCFAQLLRAAVPSCADLAQDRAMEELLYHLGRWIYLVDARDDLEEDRAARRYNPILARYGDEESDEQLVSTLDRSLERMWAACSLLELGRQRELVENVLYLGLPLIQRSVFNGSWSEIKKQKIWRTVE